MSVLPCVHLSAHPSIRLSICQSVYTTVYLSISICSWLIIDKNSTNIWEHCHIHDLCHIWHTIDFTTASTIVISLVHGWQLLQFSLSCPSGHPTDMSSTNSKYISSHHHPHSQAFTHHSCTQISSLATGWAKHTIIENLLCYNLLDKSKPPSYINW